MAGSSSSMSFRLFGEDVTASRTIRKVGDEADSTSKKLKDIGAKGLSPLMTAAASLGPALLPVLAGATLGAGALGVATVSAAAAVGVFAAVAKTAYANIGAAAKTLTSAHAGLAAADAKVTAAQYALSQAHTKTGLTAAHHRLALAMDAQAKAAKTLSDAQRTLTGPLGAAAAAQGRATAAWKRFVDLNSPAVYAIFAQGFNMITAAVPKLEPLFKVAAHAAGDLLTALGRFVTAGGLDRLVKFLAGQAAPAMHVFLSIAANVTVGIGALGRQFATVSSGMLTWLGELSVGFADWARHLGPSGGFARFVDYAKTNGPAVMATLASIAVSLVHITAAAAPLAPLSLALAKGLSGIVNAMPIPVLTGMVLGFIALNVAFKLVAISASVAAAATKVWAAANWLLDAAMTANPIGILIVTIAALVVGIVYAYRHFETFRNIVNGVWSWIKAHWPLLLGILLGPVGLAVIMIIRHWQGLVSFFDATRAKIAAIFAGIGRVFMGVVRWFEQLPGRVLAGLAALPHLMWKLFTDTLNSAFYAFGYGIGTIIKLAITLPPRIIAAIRALPGLLGRLVVSAWNAARSATVAGVTAVVVFISGLPGRAGRAVARLWSAMASAFRSAATSAGHEASSLVSGAVHRIAQLPGKAATALASMPGKIKSAFAGAGGWLISAGEDIIRGLIRGIENMAGAAARAAANAAKSALNGAKHALGIGSPSKVFADEVGRWIPPGIAAGISAGTPELVGAMSAAMGRVVDAARVPVAGSVGLGRLPSPAGTRRAVAPQSAGAGGETLIAQFFLDGKMIQESLLTRQRQAGTLGLA